MLFPVPDSLSFRIAVMDSVRSRLRAAFGSRASSPASGVEDGQEELLRHRGLLMRGGTVVDAPRLRAARIWRWKR